MKINKIVTTVRTIAMMACMMAGIVLIVCSMDMGIRYNMPAYILLEQQPMVALLIPSLLISGIALMALGSKIAE